MLKIFILHYFIFKQGLTDINWRKGLLLNVFQTAGRLMEPEHLTNIQNVYERYKRHQMYTQRYTYSYSWPFFFFSFCGPFLWDDPLIFTPNEPENHTKTNKCTGCVNTEYRGDGEGLTFTFLSFFLYGSDQLYLNNKLITSWQHCKKEEG